MTSERATQSHECRLRGCQAAGWHKDNGELAAEIERLRAALEPFAAVGQWLFARCIPDDTPMIEFDGANGYKITFTRGIFKAAHAALNPVPPADA